MILAFTIPGRPVTWQRTNTFKGRRLTDKKQREEKRRIANLARSALPKGWPLDAVYAIEVIGYWPDARVGDSDRLTSLTMDALEGVAYRADRQVRAQAGTVRIQREGPARTEVTLVPFDESAEMPVTTIEFVERQRA